MKFPTSADCQSQGRQSVLNEPHLGKATLMVMVALSLRCPQYLRKVLSEARKITTDNWIYSLVLRVTFETKTTWVRWRLCVFSQTLSVKCYNSSWKIWRMVSPSFICSSLAMWHSSHLLNLKDWFYFFISIRSKSPLILKARKGLERLQFLRARPLQFPLC